MLDNRVAICADDSRVFVFNSSDFSCDCNRQSSKFILPGEKEDPRTGGLMRRKTSVLALAISTLFITRAIATDWDYTSQGSQATELTGGYGAVGDPSSGYVYNDGEGDYSYPVILDSGSSGFLMSETVTDEFNVPLQPGQTYTETGIGGSEVENVTDPLTAYYAPASDSDPDNTSTMTAYGTYTFESRQNDPLEGLVFFDVIGTPIIQNQVMVVNPNQSYNIVQDTLGFLTAETTLQSTDPVLPSKGLYHVPITWTNFVSGNPVPSEGDNPVVNGVTALGPNGTAVANNWLFDSGAQFTIISPTYAQQLGINMNDYTVQIQGEGVGSSIVTFDGFQITDIALPLSNGDRLVFNDPTVFVPVDTTLPAGLTGILGENLFMQATDEINPYTGEPEDTYNPLFSEWYLDGPGSQLVLYDPNSAYDIGEPTLVWTGGGTDNNWSTSGNWGGTALLTGDTLVFGGTTQLASNNDTTAGTEYTGITFNAGAGAFVITGNAIGLAGSVINNSTSLQTININLALQENATFNAASADLAVGGNISGTFSLTKTGSHTLTLSGTNSYTGPTDVSAGTLVIATPGAMPANSAVNIATSALMQLAPGIGHITLSSLSIASGGQLDINNNAVIINYGGGPDPIASIESWIAAGYADGSWTGDGIMSSAAQTNSQSYGIGYADSADAGNPAGLNGNQIEIMYTLLGDANLDGKVNGADFTILAANFNQGGKTWDQGDFNYDGDVNGADFTLLAQNFNRSATQSAVGAADLAAIEAFAAANGITLTNLPEPAGTVFIGLAILALGAARRQHPCLTVPRYSGGGKGADWTKVSNGFCRSV
jgi:autotransporter-associated beta strand protein